MKPIAFITGANGGVGSAICKLLENEYKIISFVRKDYGLENQVICDLSKTKDMKKIIENAIEKYGCPELLVNNAGAYFAKPWNEETLEEFETCLSVNITAPFILTQTVGQSMIDNKIAGRIVNISSVSAYIGSLDLGYAAGKAGEIAIAKSFSKALSPYNIRVNSIAPGPINTRMGDNIPKWKQDEYKASIPLKRFAEPEEIAKAVKFLDSEDSAFMTGTVLNINGGMY